MNGEEGCRDGCVRSQDRHGVGACVREEFAVVGGEEERGQLRCLVGVEESVEALRQ